ncbi:MAG: 3-phosphoshikimate 1-carboxyvinyltransferase [Bryobacterales bacterium]|nr:3-phosphoshikimate 1-carboxyvinyltransferase [Bryobacterales bacterium]
MTRTIHPSSGIAGSISLPGDKSISHRYAMLASLAEGSSVLTNYSSGQDCASTLECMRALGARCSVQGDRVEIAGHGEGRLQAPSGPLDAGNSGTTMRLLSGILAGQDFQCQIKGDASLSQRPMKRILTPLRAMGASIDARDGEYPPLTIRGGALLPIRYELPVASAQVKSAVLLAGLRAPGTTTVVEPLETRNHSEIALRRFGADITVEARAISITGMPRLTACDMHIPSDLSSAVFFLGAALLLPGSELSIHGVGLNPTRTAVLSVLRSMGASIEAHPEPDGTGEPSGTLVIRGGHAIRGGEISGASTAGVIDEIPMLAVLGAVSENGLRIRDAGELRVKETDRIATVTANLRRMGVSVTEYPDGMDIEGRSRLRAAEIDSAGDHRIAMAFAVAALASDGDSILHGAEAASVSFPEFFDVLGELVCN